MLSISINKLLLLHLGLNSIYSDNEVVVSIVTTVWAVRRQIPRFIFFRVPWTGQYFFFHPSRNIDVLKKDRFSFSWQAAVFNWNAYITFCKTLVPLHLIRYEMPITKLGTSYASCLLFIPWFITSYPQHFRCERPDQWQAQQLSAVPLTCFPFS